MEYKLSYRQAGTYGGNRLPSVREREVCPGRRDPVRDEGGGVRERVIPVREDRIYVRESAILSGTRGGCPGRLLLSGWDGEAGARSLSSGGGLPSSPSSGWCGGGRAERRPWRRRPWRGPPGRRPERTPPPGAPARST